MLNVQTLSKKILQKQGFSESLINEKMLQNLSETLRNYYTIKITEELKPQHRATFLYLLDNNDQIEITAFLEENIEDYDQFIADLTYALEDQFQVSNLLDPGV